MEIPLDDVGVEGKDGAGQRAEVVWTRVFSKSRTPSATDGWYIVYLFSGDGERIYLSLMQGTTEWIAGELKPREPAALKKRIEWARPLIEQVAAERFDLLTEIRGLRAAQQGQLASGSGLLASCNEDDLLRTGAGRADSRTPHT